MRLPRPDAIQRRRLALGALPGRPSWTIRDLAELRIGLTPEAARCAVLRLEEEGLVKIEGRPDDTWRISLVLPADLEAIGRWIDAELA